jgi:hypothetical protein
MPRKKKEEIEEKKHHQIINFYEHIPKNMLDSGARI